MRCATRFCGLAPVIRSVHLSKSAVILPALCSIRQFASISSFAMMSRCSRELHCMESISIPTFLMQRRCFAGDTDVSKPRRGSTWEITKFVWKYMWPEGRWDLRASVIGAISFVFCAKLVKVTVPYWFKTAVDALVPGTAPAAAATFGPVTLSVFALVPAYGLSKLMASFFDEAKTVVFAKVWFFGQNSVAYAVFKKLHELGIIFHFNKQTGSLTRDLDRGARAFNSLTWSMLLFFLPTAIEMGLVATMMYNRAGSLFVLNAVGAIVLYIIFTWVVTECRTKFRDDYNKADNFAAGLVTDSLLNHETVKYFQAEEHELSRYRVANEEMNTHMFKLEWSSALMNFGQGAIFIASATANFWMGVNAVIGGTMTVGDIVLVDALLWQLQQPLNFLGIVWRELTMSAQNMDNMLTMLKEPVSILPDPLAPKIECDSGAIEFKNVSYKYEETRPILRDISFCIPGGSTVGLVGPSGGGKTTILRLLFRLIDPTTGAVLIDGQQITDYDLCSLRSHISMIPQDCVLFNDTVRRNIAYGKFDATDEEIEAAAKAAQIHDIIVQLPEKYNTIVGERGLKMSGGEKQRMAIARAMLRNSTIVLADEATSALDSRTEYEVMRCLKRTPSGRQRTLVMIAHRLATVRDADIIFVFTQEGALAEQGTHDDLLQNRDGAYFKLWTQQQREIQKQTQKKKNSDNDPE